MNIRHASVIVLSAAVLVLDARGQCAPPAWSSANSYWGINGPVYATIEWDPDGAGPLPSSLVIGGSFSQAGTETTQNAVRWDGTTWTAMDLGAYNNPVRAFTIFNGELIAAGDLIAGGAGVARWTGTSWAPMGVAQGSVFALSVYNGELFAGGSFQNVSGGGVIDKIVRWDGANWQPLPGAAGWTAVNALAVYGGELVAGGQSTFGTFNHIARWNGSIWQPLSPLGLSAQVNALTVYGGDLVAGGYFLTAGGQNAQHVARWDGAAWHSMWSIPDPVWTICQAMGSLVVSSVPQAYGALGVATVRKWTGATWQTLASGQYSGDASVTTLLERNGELVAGAFGLINGVFMYGLSRFDGTSWSNLLSTDGVNAPIYAMTELGGDLVAGGSFSIKAGNAYNFGIGRWNGSTWQALGAGLPASQYPISALGVYNGELIAGGRFTAGGGSAEHIARWNGASWQPLGSGIVGGAPPSQETPNTYVRALAVYNGQLVAGGAIATAGGVPVSNIARWNGTSWQPLGSGTLGTVQALVVYNGELIAGGTFTSAGGVAASRVARWNGTSWQPLGAGVAGPVRALCIYQGDLIAAGSFPTAGGVPAICIARWDGVAWHPLGNVGNAGVNALAVHGGELFAASRLWALPTGDTNGIARWDGVSWLPLGGGMAVPTTNPPAQYGPFALASYRGALLAGGTFYGAPGVGSPYFARWSSPLPMISVTQPGGSGTGVQIDDRWLVAGHEYFNVASLELCPAGPGTGPWGGLCAADPAFLFQQISLPLGTEPFHFLAGGTTVTFGPYGLPPGFAFEAISVDLTGGAIGCLSTAVRHVVY